MIIPCKARAFQFLSPYKCATFLCTPHFFAASLAALRRSSLYGAWGGQTERETPLADHKLHAARVRVCVGLAALTGVGCGIGGQPVLEVGVVCANIDQRLFLVKPNIGGLFLLGKPCSDASSFLPVGMEKGQSIARLSLVGYLFSFTVCCSIIDVQFFKTCWWQTAF